MDNDRTIVTEPTQTTTELTETETENGRRRRRALRVTMLTEGGYAVAATAMSLVDPNRLSPGKRLAYRLGEAALAASASSLAVGAGEHGMRGMSRIGVAAFGAGASLGFAEISERFDARVVSFLRRRGVAQPRLVIAAATFGLQALSAVPSVLEAARGGVDASGGAEDVTDRQHRAPVTAPLPPQLRRLLTVVLAADDSIDGGALAAQLDGAQLREDVHAAFDGWMMLQIEDGVARSPLRQYTHPVSVHASDHDGRGVLVTVDIQDGALSSVDLAWLDADTEDGPSYPAPVLEELSLAGAELVNGFGEQQRRRPFPAEDDDDREAGAPES